MPTLSTRREICSSQFKGHRILKALTTEFATVISLSIAANVVKARSLQARQKNSIIST